jgi:hypothetical protein
MLDYHAHAHVKIGYRECTTEQLRHRGTTRGSQEEDSRTTLLRPDRK